MRSAERGELDPNAIPRHTLNITQYPPPVYNLPWFLGVQPLLVEEGEMSSMDHSHPSSTSSFRCCIDRLWPMLSKSTGTLRARVSSNLKPTCDTSVQWLGIRLSDCHCQSAGLCKPSASSNVASWPSKGNTWVFVFLGKPFLSRNHHHYHAIYILY